MAGPTNRGHRPRSPLPDWFNAGMRSFTINALGPFSLDAAAAFMERFPAASFGRTEAGELALAFVVDGAWQPIGVELHQRRAAVNGQFWGEAPAEGVRRQVQRIFSLDVDGRPFPSVAQRDPVVATLQARYPGLRPVCFWSVYESAVWAIIGHRVRMAQAAAIRARLIQELGHELAVEGRVLRAFPGPQRLAELQSFPGLGGRKPEYLRAVAAAALAGELDGDRLRDLPRDEALAELRRIAGIGEVSAELILIRGAGEPDRAPRFDKRLAAAIGEAYHLGHAPTAEEFDRITANWRPFRSWVSFLMRASVDAWDLPT